MLWCTLNEGEGSLGQFESKKHTAFRQDVKNVFLHYSFINYFIFKLNKPLPKTWHMKVKLATMTNVIHE